MWDKVTRHLAKYPSAILTGIDSQGYPYSVRCVPQTDSAQQVLRITLPAYVELQPGPAGLLCHYHDDRLWQQTNFVLRGRLEHRDEGWLFKPTQFIEGAGAGMSMIRQIREGRRAAKQYLNKRNLERPRIPWDKLKAIYNRVQKR